MPLEVYGRLGVQQFPVQTYPKHENQGLPNSVVERAVVWDRCKVPPLYVITGTTPVGGTADVFYCPQSEVVMATSTNTGSTWNPPASIDTTPGDKLMPWIKSDISTHTLNIAYYSSQDTPMFHLGLQLMLLQIPQSGSPPPALAVTSKPNYPSAEAFFLVNGPAMLSPSLGFDSAVFFGDYIGLASRGTGSVGQSRAYPGWTSNERQGKYGWPTGINAPGEDNHLGRINY